MYLQTLWKVNISVFNNTSGLILINFCYNWSRQHGVTLTQGTKTFVYTTGTTMVDIMANLGAVNASSLSVNNSPVATAGFAVAMAIAL
jgi:hypothetical protein